MLFSFVRQMTSVNLSVKRMVLGFRFALALAFAAIFSGTWVSDVSSVAAAMPQEGRPGQNASSAALEQEDEERARKLQAEKQKSMERLEKTAAEIARKWRERNEEGSTGGENKSGSKTPRANTTNDIPSTLPEESQGNSTSTTPGQLDSKSGTMSDRNSPDRGSENSAQNSGDSPPDPSTTPDNRSAGSADATMDPHTDSSATDTRAAREGNGGMPSDPRLVGGPIDRLALATSLFATGQLRECLKILEAVELRPLSVEDRQWHDFVAAGCYRKLGKQSEAAGLYRSVLQRSSSTWIAPSARWWLDHIDERAQLELKLQQVQQTLGNWRKEVDILKKAQ